MTFKFVLLVLLGVLICTTTARKLVGSEGSLDGDKNFSLGHWDLGGLGGGGGGGFGGGGGGGGGTEGGFGSGGGMGGGIGEQTDLPYNIQRFAWKK
ncbi:glycine-rich protein 5-like [Olea europaea var. sylvestris]|uniref:glycine-rich protein 5-like n=1 Tax=Olea europaea var. sylvestris TaxID=158386 RepID=UPI000C1CE25A|nr:glycine-rich protein 5-like [Olea europaea var. sylvestris]